MLFLRNLALSKIAKIITVIVSILYPLCIVFKGEYLREVILLMIICWWANAILEKDSNKKIRNAGICIFFVIVMLTKNQDLMYFYPILVSLVFLFIFGLSLKGEAVITKLARFKNKNLDEKAICYTRNLTKIWMGFFVINIIICIILLTFENKSYWAFYCSFISYILMGILFFVEILFRKFYLKKD